MPEFKIKVTREMSRLVLVTAGTRVRAETAARDWFDCNVTDEDVMEEAETETELFDFGTLTPDARVFA
jgi:hypothetical protein